MINEEKTRMKCREDFSLIQNYDKAISDQEQTFDCHHRLGTVIPKKKLLEMDLYFNRPAIELIFLTHKEHISLHHKDKKRTDKTRNNISKSLKGRIFSEEWKQNLKDAHKGQIPWNKGLTLSEETKKKLSEAAKRRPPISEDTRQKISEAAKRRPPISEETRQKLSEAAKRRPPVSDETRKKQSESHKGKLPWNKGKTMSNESKQKNREAHQGKHLSEETRKKQSEANKGNPCPIKGKHRVYDDNGKFHFEF